MKHKRTVEVPAKRETVVDRVTCDLCGGPVQPSPLSFDVSYTAVYFRSGEQYPEGGSGTQVEFDLCGSCFDGKLVPWMKGQGATPAVTDWET